MSTFGNGEIYQENEGISRWTDLAKIVCVDVNDGPPDRNIPPKNKNLKSILGGLDSSEDSDALLRNDLEGDEVSFLKSFIFDEIT